MSNCSRKLQKCLNTARSQTSNKHFRPSNKHFSWNKLAPLMSVYVWKLHRSKSQSALMMDDFDHTSIFYFFKPPLLRLQTLRRWSWSWSWSTLSKLFICVLAIFDSGRDGCDKHEPLVTNRQTVQFTFFYVDSVLQAARNRSAAWHVPTLVNLDCGLACRQ